MPDGACVKGKAGEGRHTLRGLAACGPGGWVGKRLKREEPCKASGKLGGEREGAVLGDAQVSRGCCVVSSCSGHSQA